MKPARRLGTYGTSAFRAPSRQDLNARAAANASNSLATASGATAATPAAAAGTIPAVDEHFIPKSSFDEAAKRDGIKGSTVAARMKSQQPRFQKSLAEREREARDSRAGPDAELAETVFSSSHNKQRQVSPTPNRAPRQIPDFARDRSPRIAFHSVATPAEGEAASSAGRRRAGSSSTNTPTRSRRTGSPVVSSRPIATDDPLAHLTISSRVQRSAQRIDPVFASAAPRFRRLGAQGTIAASASSTANVTANADFYVPRDGISDQASRHATVQMSSDSASERFPEKHSVTERADFYAPRGFAEEVVRKNEAARRRQAAMASRSSSLSSRAGGGGGANGTLTQRSVTGQKIQPRFREPERLTSQCQLYVAPGLAEKVASTALSRRSPAFSRPVSPSANKRLRDEAEDRQQHQHMLAKKREAEQELPDSCWAPKSMVDEILRKDTAGAAFRSTTPRFAPRRLQASASANSAPLADLLEKRDKPDIEAIRRTGSAPAGGSSIGGKRSSAVGSSMFASNVPRWQDKKRSQAVPEATFVPDSFVDRILSK